MNDQQPFESSEILIEGGKDRIDDLEAECDAFIEASSHEIIRKIDPNTGDEFYKFRFAQRITPKIRHIASGIINDLRNALDHAFCDAAVLLGRTDAKGVHFPFSQSAAEIDGQIKRVCRGVDPALCNFAKALQPYPGGDDLLYKLATLANANKHRSIIRLSAAERSLSFVVERLGRYGIGEIEIGMLGWNDLRNEFTFLRVGKNRFVPADFQDHVKPVLQVVLEKGEPPLSDPAPTALRAFAGKVDGIVLGLKRETARLLELGQP